MQSGKMTDLQRQLAESQTQAEAAKAAEQAALAAAGKVEEEAAARVGQLQSQ